MVNQQDLMSMVTQHSAGATPLQEAAASSFVALTDDAGA